MFTTLRSFPKLTIQVTFAGGSVTLADALEVLQSRYPTIEFNFVPMGYLIKNHHPNPTWGQSILNEVLAIGNKSIKAHKPNLGPYTDENPHRCEDCGKRFLDWREGDFEDCFV